MIPQNFVQLFILNSQIWFSCYYYSYWKCDAFGLTIARNCFICFALNVLRCYQLHCALCTVIIAKVWCVNDCLNYWESLVCFKWVEYRYLVLSVFTCGGIWLYSMWCWWVFIPHIRCGQALHACGMVWALMVKDSNFQFLGLIEHWQCPQHSPTLVFSDVMLELSKNVLSLGFTESASCSVN